jgi:hypothetical protein
MDSDDIHPRRGRGNNQRGRYLAKAVCVCVCVCYLKKIIIIIFKNNLCVFILTVHLIIWTLCNFGGMFCIYVVKIIRQFTHSKCKVASLLWFAYYGIRVYGGAQLLSFSHLVDHISIPLIF